MNFLRRCKSCGYRIGHKRCCTFEGVHDWEPVWQQSILSGVPCIVKTKCSLCGLLGPLTGAGLQQREWEAQLTLNALLGLGLAEHVKMFDPHEYAGYRPLGALDEEIAFTLTAEQRDCIGREVARGIPYTAALEGLARTE